MSGTQAVDRAALLLATVVRATEPVGFAALAELCELPRSTTSRLLAALERTELIGRHGSGAYVAGPLFAEYATRHDRFAELVGVAGPVLEHIGGETGETVNLGVPHGDGVRHVAQVDARFLLGTRDWTQVDVPPHASALGKALYAHGILAPPSGPMAALTERTATDPVAFADELALVRRRGWAATVDELEPGLTGVAVAVLDPDGTALAALGISGPTTRLADRLTPIGRLLTAQSERITSLLGKVGAA